MEIIQKSDEKYLKDGIKAIKEYRLNELRKDIKEVIASQKGNLKTECIEKKFKKDALKIAGVSLGGQKAILNFMNKNEYIGKTAENIESSISKNYLVFRMVLPTIEHSLGVKIRDLGFEEDSYKPILKAFQEKGLVGKGSGLDFIVDKLMKNTENVVAAASKVLAKGKDKDKSKDKDKWDVNKINKFMSPIGITIKGIEEVYEKGRFKGKKGVFNYITGKVIDNLENVSALVLNEISKKKIKKMSVSQIKKASSNLGITIKDIQKVYKESGLNGENGVIKYLSDSVIINGIKEVYKEMLPPEFGKDEKFTSEDMIKAYKKGGIVGRKGLVNKAVGLAFLRVPSLDKVLYSHILELTEDYKTNQEIKNMDKELPHGLGFRICVSNLMDLEGKFKELSTKMPKEMSQAKLEKVYKNQGVFGDKGLISYLSQTIPLIFENAKEIGALDEADVKDLSKIPQSFRNLSSLENFKFGQRNKYELFAIGIAKKSEEMKIGSKELLSNPAYIGVKRDIIKQVHGSVEGYERYCEVCYQSASELLKIMYKMGNPNAEEIIEKVKDNKPEGLFGMAFDKLTKKYINQENVNKTNDYLNLTKALVEQQLEKNKKELQAYKAVKN